jgi:hypothetical protein
VSSPENACVRVVDGRLSHWRFESHFAIFLGVRVLDCEMSQASCGFPL